MKPVPVERSTVPQLVFADHAWLQTGWARNVLVRIDDRRIEAVEQVPAAPQEAYRASLLLPALANLHSHGFQRIIAGMTEMRAQGAESFWTWRAQMYRCLEHLTPDHVEDITALAFMQMLEAGYASVGEFHYLHHAPGGTPYADLAEMSVRVMSAAQTTGIGLTLLPVLYTCGGLAGQKLEGGQMRFGNDLARYLDLVSRCADQLRHMPADACLGRAPHSLRATQPGDLADLLADMPEGPVHIHVAEQMREVDEVRAHLGARPVAWLLDNLDVSPRWCLVHATHMTTTETQALAASGAVAGLCPVTEANLGDGIFPAAAFLAAGGRFGVGTDSNINVALCEELRLLEYGQRLTQEARAVLAPSGASVGEALYRGALAGGAQAMGRETGRLAVGQLADLVALDATHHTLVALSPEQILDGWLFASGSAPVTDVWSAGRHVVRMGRHIEHAAIVQRFRRTAAALAELW